MNEKPDRTEEEILADLKQRFEELIELKKSEGTRGAWAVIGGAIGQAVEDYFKKK